MKENYAIIAPCYNEANIIDEFLKDLEQKLSITGERFTVIIVDDCSLDSTVEKLKEFSFNSSFFELRVIQLKFNIGHQECIRQGIIFTNSMKIQFKGVIVLDSDGEDDPEAIIQLLKIPNPEIVFVSRGKRNENIRFKVGYFIYKLIFKIFTGKEFSFGNYSLIGQKVLKQINGQKFFHYSAFLSKQKMNIEKIIFDRKQRIGGHSKMNYQNLIYHGLKSFIEYSEELLFMLIKVFAFIILFSLGFGGILLYNKFVSHEAILGWASTIGIVLINIAITVFGTIILSLLLLSIKHNLKQTESSYEEIK